jgi:3-hydroxyisobutyrate dehydrogenase-like beta-hydroxyacid dehydrogenase
MGKDLIGFIGTGRMGGGMAMRLLDTGWPVIVYDTDPAATTPLAAAGATVAPSPRAVADAAGIVFACLPSKAVSLAVAGEIAGGSAVRLYIESSTIGSATMAKIRDVLAGTSIGLLDAPISGGPTGALAGTLSIAVAGAAPDLERARPILDDLARRVFYLGPQQGQAQIAKLINNLSSLASRVVAFEGQVLGMSAGIDPQVLNDFVNASTGRSTTTEDFPARVLHPFRTGGKTSIGVKDTELFLEEAARRGLPVWTAPQVLELFREGEAYGIEPDENLRLTDYVERLAEIARLKATRS